MYGGKSAHDVLQALLDNPQASAYDVVVANAKTYIKGDFANGWRKALHDGWVEGTAFTAKAGGTGKSAAASFAAPSGVSGLEISFRPDPSLYDGRFANVGWLQELPKQVTNLSWDNAAIMSMGTMADLKLEESDPVKITFNGRECIAAGAGGSRSCGWSDHGSPWIWPRSGGWPCRFRRWLRRLPDRGPRTRRYYLTGATANKVPGTYDLCITKVHNIEHRGSFCAA